MAMVKRNRLLDDVSARGWRFVWEQDYLPDLSWCECAEGEVEHDHEVLGCMVKDQGGRVLASLWGIVDADQAYAREVEAELAAEALAMVAAEERVKDAAIARQLRWERIEAAAQRVALYESGLHNDSAKADVEQFEDAMRALRAALEGSK